MKSGLLFGVLKLIEGCGFKVPLLVEWSETGVSLSIKPLMDLHPICELADDLVSNKTTSMTFVNTNIIIDMNSFYGGFLIS